MCRTVAVDCRRSSACQAAGAPWLMAGSWTWAKEKAATVCQKSSILIVMNAYKTPSLHTFTIYGVAGSNRRPVVQRLTYMRHRCDLFAALLLGMLLLPAGRAIGQ